MSLEESTTTNEEVNTEASSVTKNESKVTKQSFFDEVLKSQKEAEKAISQAVQKI